MNSSPEDIQPPDRPYKPSPLDKDEEIGNRWDFAIGLDSDGNLFPCNSWLEEAKIPAEWRLLDIDDVPSEPGIYGWRWRGSWVYIGESKNLASCLRQSRHYPLRIAISLNDIEFFWKPSSEQRRLGALMKRDHQPHWNGHWRKLAEPITASSFLHCELDGNPANFTYFS